MDVLSYILAADATRVLAAVAGFWSGIVSFSLLARVVQR